MPPNSHESETGDDNHFSVCPMTQAFEEIGSKWRLVILHYLVMNGEQRFNSIKEDTPADSSTLSRVLKELEERDLIRRRLEDRPIATYYDLTEKGESLAIMFDDIEAWADDWTDADSESESLPNSE
ncbi:winged helix-turn-helix transcriptional regulator [Salinirubellus sp. GCM10025818]|uniref:winged helix-turn-helix transcriptional regulator n=1 Tax=Salinirubellus TaxID=2162630 RepID=UPI0030D27954